MAAEAGLPRAIAQLLAAGADRAATDRFGWTPAHLAAKGGHVALMHMLAVPDAPVDWMGRSAEDLLQMTTCDAPATGPSECADSSSVGGGSANRRSWYTPHNGDGSAKGDKDHGGWPADEITQYAVAHCDVPVIDAAMANVSRAFWDHHVAIGRPVLIRGAAAQWAFKEWTPARVKARLGAAQVSVSTVPYADVYGGGRRNTTTVAKFVDSILQRGRGSSAGSTGESNECRDRPPDGAAGTHACHKLVPYVFSEVADSDLGMFDAYFKDIFGSPLFAAEPTSVQFKHPQFFVGPPGSAAPMHFHEDAINALAFGRKHWALVPPHRAEFSTLPGLRWLEANVGLDGGSSRGVGAMQCMQEAGDIMYVPHGWGHAVINTMTSIGIATNFEQPLRSY